MRRARATSRQGGNGKDAGDDDDWEFDIATYKGYRARGRGTILSTPQIIGIAFGVIGVVVILVGGLVVS